jgi:hypothetical protein
MFQYKSNDTNFTQYNQVLVAVFIRSKFALECACALFVETEVVIYRALQVSVIPYVIVLSELTKMDVTVLQCIVNLAFFQSVGRFM